MYVPLSGISSRQILRYLDAVNDPGSEAAVAAIFVRFFSPAITDIQSLRLKHGHYLRSDSRLRPEGRRGLVRRTLGPTGRHRLLVAATRGHVWEATRRPALAAPQGCVRRTTRGGNPRGVLRAGTRSARASGQRSSRPCRALRSEDIHSIVAGVSHAEIRDSIALHERFGFSGRPSPGVGRKSSTGLGMSPGSERPLNALRITLHNCECTSENIQGTMDRE